MEIGRNPKGTESGTIQRRLRASQQELELKLERYRGDVDQNNRNRNWNGWRAGLWVQLASGLAPRWGAPQAPWAPVEGQAKRLSAVHT